MQEISAQSTTGCKGEALSLTVSALRPLRASKCLQLHAHATWSAPAVAVRLLPAAPLHEEVQH
jgi:hypothetical protein